MYLGYTSSNVNYTQPPPFPSLTPPLLCTFIPLSPPVLYSFLDHGQSDECTSFYLCQRRTISLTRNVYRIGKKYIKADLISGFLSTGRPLPRLVWWRDGRIIDDSYATTFENTVRNDLWLQSLGRQDVDVTLTCEASNSNLTQAVSTSVTIDLYRKILI